MKALIEAKKPAWSYEKKDYSAFCIDTYFINANGSIRNESAGYHFKHCESYESAKKWLIQFIEVSMRGEILCIVESE
jgi:hypothetical protein